MQTLDELVAAAPIFSGLRHDDLSTIAGCSRTAQFGAGEHIFREGEHADAFFLLRRGSVALETFAPGRGSLRIATLHEGDVLGWSWLFPPYRWHFDAVALDSVGAVTFDAVCLRGKCDEDHDLGYQLMQRFAELMVNRLQATRLQLLDVYGDARG